MTDDYIDKLVRTYPSINEIWLLGSRANDRARPTSDWDYLVFADDSTLLSALRHDTQFNLPQIDLLLVVEGTAVKPWEPTAAARKLCLHADLAWTELSANQATYLQVKKRNPGDPGDMTVNRKQSKAKLIYRRPSRVPQTLAAG